VLTPLVWPPPQDFKVVDARSIAMLMNRWRIGKQVPHTESLEADADTASSLSSGPVAIGLGGRLGVTSTGASRLLHYVADDPRPFFKTFLQYCSNIPKLKSSSRLWCPSRNVRSCAAVD
jgi:hypothetical protein